MDYTIRFIDLPYSINGLTVEDLNGFYNIYINSRLSHDIQQKAVIHELTHVRRKDFDRAYEPLQTIENVK